MRSFKDLPIQRKLLLMTLAICGAVLLSAAGALFVFQMVTFRSAFQRDTATLASIVANNSTAALAFNDQHAAEEVLGSLIAKPTVLSAALTSRTMALDARFRSRDDLAAYPPPGVYRFVGGDLLFTQPVVLDGKEVGKLYLRSDYRGGLLKLLRFYGLISIAVVTVSVLLAGLLSSRFCRFITDPIQSLAATASTVGERHDYSMRSSVANHADELGALAGAFNRMVSRIQAQDAALTLSQQKLESLVNSLDGIVWEWDPARAAFAYVSRQSERILGYSPEEWISDSNFWERHVHPEDRVEAVQRCKQVVELQQPYSYDYRMISSDDRVVWIRESGVFVIEQDKPLSVRGILLDVTSQKAAAAELNQLHQQLLEASRQAGMAEVATGVLHNVGNVLNSVNVSAGLLRDRLSQSELRTLNRLAALMSEQNGNLGSFLTEHPKGRLIPQAIVQVSGQLSRERDFYVNELSQLARNVEHINDIVAMQQSYARISGVLERIALADAVEDALRIEQAAMERAGVEVVRNFAPVPIVTVDRHKTLQILINLIRNARIAMTENHTGSRRLTVSIEPMDPGGARIVVQDTGVGIPAPNLTRIFSHGFTTRKDGHGFGLHIGALNARQMGGSLTAASEGEGRGAVFTLTLPLEPKTENVL
ncbi:MAG TPA: PAS domain-containing protein [Verrucomicrobiae bacterium]|nr:PAS domain-containing protein [Verrucomicrobiae bacterium]